VAKQPKGELVVVGFNYGLLEAGELVGNFGTSPTPWRSRRQGQEGEGLTRP
jgi:hypothetical protein